jgi:hypothetical protein
MPLPPLREVFGSNQTDAQVGCLTRLKIVDRADEFDPMRVEADVVARTDRRPLPRQQCGGDLKDGAGAALCTVEVDHLIDEPIGDRFSESETERLTPVSGRVVSHRECHSTADSRCGDA